MPWNTLPSALTSVSRGVAPVLMLVLVGPDLLCLVNAWPALRPPPAAAPPVGGFMPQWRCLTRYEEYLADNTDNLAASTLASTKRQ